MCRRQYANDACNRGTAGKFNVNFVKNLQNCTSISLFQNFLIYMLNFSATIIYSIELLFFFSFSLKDLQKNISKTAITKNT